MFWDFRYDEESARMAKSADAADLKSADLNRSWGFKSPSGHQKSRAYDTVGSSLETDFVRSLSEISVTRKKSATTSAMR